MEQHISIRGRTARKMVKVANHMPILGHKAQNGELRARLSEHEKLWECPEHLMLTVIDMHLFKMELLQRRIASAANGDENNEDTLDTLDVSADNADEESDDNLKDDHIKQKSAEIKFQEAETEAAGIDDNKEHSEKIESVYEIDDKNDINDTLPTQNERGIIIQLHGGGYYGKLHNTYRDMAGLYNELSQGFDVLSVDYRVAPDNPYPAALDDAVAAYEWALKRDYPKENIFVVGDSAGGGLALALCLYLRDHNIQMPAGIITMSAWTDLTKSGESYEEKFDIDPIFGGSIDTLVYKEGYYRENDPEDPYISPVNGDYTGFPPMLMQVGEYEMLLSDTMTVAEKAKQAGVSVKEHIYPGMFHVFQMGLTRYPESKEAWVEIGKFFRYVRKM